MRDRRRVFAFKTGKIYIVSELGFYLAITPTANILLKNGLIKAIKNTFDTDELILTQQGKTIEL